MERGPHVDDHSEKKDQTEYHSVEHIEEIKAYGSSHEYQKKTRAAHAAFVYEHCKSAPIYNA